MSCGGLFCTYSSGLTSDLTEPNLTSDEVRNRERHSHEGGGGRPEDPHPGLLHQHQAGPGRHMQSHHRSAAGESLQSDAERCQETQRTIMNTAMKIMMMMNMKKNRPT